MKKIFSVLSIILFTSQAYSIVGFGAYGDMDLLKYPSGTSGDINTSGVSYDGFDNARGFGFMFYIDAIPIVDLELDIEFVGNTYKYIPYIGGIASTEGDMPWGRVSTYMTVRKEIVGLSIPFLAKAQLYGGIGFNKHKVLPVMTLELIQNAFPSANDLDAALTQSTSSEDQMEALADYMLDQAENISGIHLQTGVRAKLLVLNVFLNARYTIAKDVIPGKSGFPSVWAGLAFGI